MTWKTFTGGDEELYFALLKQRAFEAGVESDREKLNKYFRLHLHRGISYMTGNTKLLKIEDLIRIGTL
jgi:DNA sulfur modification protein DndE